MLIYFVRIFKSKISELHILMNFFNFETIFRTKIEKFGKFLHCCVGCVLKIRAYCCQRNGNHLVGGLVLKDVLQRRASSLYSSSREIWGTSLVMAEAVVVEREMKMAVLSRLLSVQP